MHAMGPMRDVPDDGCLCTYNTERGGGRLSTRLLLDHCLRAFNIHVPIQVNCHPYSY